MLPYGSLGAAEAALGRNLTFWELKWYEYTANVEDYKLYCFNIVFLFIIFNFAPLPSVVLDFLKVKSFEKYRLQPGVHNSQESIWQCYRRVTVLFFAIVGPLQLLSYPAVKVLSSTSTREGMMTDLNGKVYGLYLFACLEKASKNFMNFSPQKKARTDAK